MILGRCARALLVIGACGLTASAVASAGGDRVVLSVGKQQVTVSEVQKQLDGIPRYQLRMLGPDADAIREKFITQLTSFELLAEAGAEDKLGDEPRVRSRIDSALRTAMQREIRDQLKVAPVSPEQVKAYYEANAERYRAEERIKIWQIVVKSRAAADRILKTVRDDPSFKADPIKVWGDLARKHSIDSATAMRRGNLGFVRPDGSTAHKHVKIDPTIYQAATKIRNGEIFPAPVPLGDAYVVLQRRASHMTPERSLKDEERAIRGLLKMKQRRSAVAAVISELRQKYVTMVEPEKLNTLEITTDGRLRPKRRPGALMSRSKKKSRR